MEHFSDLDKKVSVLVKYLSKLDEDTKYAAMVYAVVKLLLANYSVIEALGIVNLVMDQIKDEAKENIPSLSKSLYI